MKSQTLAVSSLHVRANRFDLLSRLADDLAHEIKNPLHAAVINLELLRRRVQGGEAEDALKRVQLLEEEIARVHELVDWLTRLLRAAPVVEQGVDPVQVVAEMLSPLQVLGRLQRVEIELRPAPSAGTVATDRARIRHAALNLIVNALDALQPEGGRITIEGEITNAEVIIRVRDSGPGITPEAIEHLGSPGFSTRPGRHGLGLAVTRHLVEEVGGSLDNESTDGDGAAFRIALPRVS